MLMASAIGLLAAARAPAQEKTVDCNSPNLNQGQLNQCAAADFQAADATLNVLYRRMMAKYDAANQALLKAAEVKWIAFRDAECDYETNLSVGGSIHPMVYDQCRAAKTKARVQELNAQVNCQEGDLSCNGPS
jgi:uncharacterized protein YecT (DUF1311 family)